MSIIGVDPGGRTTGIVLMSDRTPGAAVLVTRDGDMASYLVEVTETIRDMIDHQATDWPTVAVEGINDPSPHMGIMSVRGLIDAAQVLGAVLATFPDAVVVPPGGHGSKPLAAYPSELVGETEQKGTGKRRHLRSAWDVAMAARLVR